MVRATVNFPDNMVNMSFAAIKRFFQRQSTDATIIAVTLIQFLSGFLFVITFPPFTGVFVTLIPVIFSPLACISFVIFFCACLTSQSRSGPITWNKRATINTRFIWPATNPIMSPNRLIFIMVRPMIFFLACITPRRLRIKVGYIYRTINAIFLRDYPLCFLKSSLNIFPSVPAVLHTPVTTNSVFPLFTNVFITNNAPVHTEQLYRKRAFRDSIK